jgi:hypothetical protein
MRVVSILAMRLLALALLLTGLAACGAGGGGGPSDLGGVPTTIVLPSTTIGAASSATVPAPATPQTVLPDYASLVATARTPESSVFVYEQPSLTAVSHRLRDQPAVTGGAPFEGPAGFRVLSQRADGWVQVQLPYSLQNRTAAWVRDADVTITQVSYRMHVSLSAGRTPAGHYFLRGFFTAPKSRTTNSPFVYGLIQKLSTLIPLGTPVDIAR